MVNWYYVDGTERVGPVGVETLQSLFKDSKIGLETYVWKKGFANWERLKNVNDLDYFQIDEEVANEEANEIEVSSVEENNHAEDEVTYTIDQLRPFNWRVVDKNECRFFIQTGTDRKKIKKEVYGPYNLLQLIEAYHQKRINEQTLIFTAGLQSWQPLNEVDFFKEELGLSSLSFHQSTKEPLFLVYTESENHHWLLVKSIANRNATVLSDKEFITDTTVQASLFKGKKLIKQNISLTIESQKEFSQEVRVILDQINDDVVNEVNEFNE